MLKTNNTFKLYIWQATYQRHILFNVLFEDQYHLQELPSVGDTSFYFILTRNYGEATSFSNASAHTTFRKVLSLFNFIFDVIYSKHHLWGSTTPQTFYLENRMLGYGNIILCMSMLSKTGYKMDTNNLTDHVIARKDATHVLV